MISAVLLAGGESSRMGQNKATISFREEPLWKWQLDLLRRIRPVELLVSARIDPTWRPKDTLFVADQQPACGPLGGIAAALTCITEDHLLAIAIDMPFMTDAYLHQLCEQVLPGRGLIPMIESRAEPLAAIYPREAKDEFLRALSGNDFSLQPLVRDLIAVRKLSPVKVVPGDAPLFRNLNRPQDLAHR